MNALNFETGLVTYSINGTCEVAFNPTDSYFVERLFNAFDSLDKKQDAYRTEVERTANKREIFDLARARDEEMRGIIDDLFGQPVCAEVFGGMNVYAIASGLPVWCNFMLAVIDEIDTTFAREQKATNPRIAKYTEKYKK
jgi:hypothetical protein